MNTRQTPTKPLTQYILSINSKLASLWTTLMFLYIYADYFELMTPGKLERMMQLQTPMGPTSPGLLVVFSAILIIPALMIFLSMYLKPPINKWLNIGTALLYASISILIIASSFDSEWHTFYVLFNFVELGVFALIIGQAWKWPRAENS